MADETSRGVSPACRLPEPLRRYAVASEWQRDEQDRDRQRRALAELGTRSRS